MKGLLLFAILLVSVSAVARIEKLKKRWDIAEGITAAASIMGKAEGHESTVREAWNKLSSADQARITNPTTKDRPYFESSHIPPAIIMGVQYPDMPIGGADVTQLGDDLTEPTHVNAATFGALFKAGSLGARNTFVAHTHYGCLQFWHAMAPEPYVANNGYKVWTNANLSALIKAATRRIWGVAVAHYKAGRKNMAEFHLGRILHTIGDSFAQGHTVRGPSNCGKILVFQEYNAQKGNEAHGAADKPDAHKDSFACTVTRINEVLQAWAACTRDTANKCGYPSIIDSTFDVDPAVANLDAGGSLDFYAGPEAKKQTPVTINAAGKTLTVYFPAQGTRTRIAGDADLSHVCPRF